ncbi:MAG TPA: molybdopterin-synthase adenylyltransferase MoeB [Cellulomonas sp.]
MPLPPLVEPAAELVPTELARYARHVLIPSVGDLGQRRLKNARVLVVGAGGLGSPVLLYLAAAGVGTIGIVDDDVVDASNLQRQVIHGSGDVGRSKVLSAAESIRDVNPLVRVVPHEVRIDASNAAELVAGYDLVVDGTDNFPTRYLVNDACVLAGKPLVWGSVLRFDGQVSVFWAAPPAGSGYEPVHYRDVFPDPPAPGSVPSCAEAGVLGVVCASVGAMMATEAVKLITGLGEPLLGRLLVLDALGATWREVRVHPDPRGVPVTGLVDMDAACALPAPPSISATELARRLADRERGADDFDLVDVREPAEQLIVAIPGARLLPRGAFLDGSAFADLDPDRPLVLHCKSGARSADVLRIVRERGFTAATHLEGGVLAWVDEIDPALPRY